MIHEPIYRIDVRSHVHFLRDDSDPARHHYVFAYTITMSNQGVIPATLLSRHWYITDANNHTQEVKGKGVVGKQPYLLPGEAFEYTSYAAIKTPVGSMHGAYHFVAEDGQTFAAAIPMFTLAIPTILN